MNDYEISFHRGDMTGPSVYHVFRRTKAQPWPTSQSAGPWEDTGVRIKSKTWPFTPYEELMALYAEQAARTADQS